MSRTKLLLDLVGSIRSVAEDLEAIVNCMMADDSPANDPGTKPLSSASASDTTNPAPTQGSSDGASVSVANDESPITFQELKDFIIASAKTTEQRAQVKALLAKHGVRKLPELPEAEYTAFKKEVAAIV